MLDGIGPCLRNVERLDNLTASMIARMMRTGTRVDLDHFARMDVDLTRYMGAHHGDKVIHRYKKRLEENK